MKRGVWLLAAVCGAAAISRAEETDAIYLRLRPQVIVTGDTVTLGDVLVFGEAGATLAEQVAGLPLLPADLPDRGTTVTREQVLARLKELNVNLARVLVGGALRCDVTRAAPASAPAAPPAAVPSERPQTDRPSGARTLADLLRAHVQSELAAWGGDADVRFERAGNEFLPLTTPPWDFVITSQGRDKLGLRSFHVTVRRDGRVQRKIEVFAHVRLVRPVVVARKPLNPGNFVRPDDVLLETRVFDTGAAAGPARVEEVVGQQVKKFIAAGQMVTPETLQAVDLVRRSRPVTVVGEGGAVEVRLTGVALDSGGFGETVRVRTGDTRGARQVLRGVVTGLGTVRLAEGEQ